MKKCEYKLCKKEMPIENKKGSNQRWKDSKYCSSKCAALANILKSKEAKESIPVVQAAYKLFCL